jgi:4-amino-4-deoxy-L-arabinose transferase-like glycosyltransferase
MPDFALMKSTLTNRHILLLVILGLAIAPYFIKLGASSLWDANEAFYAQTPREMINSGDYLNPSFNFKPRFNKPPLCYWVVAGSYKIFGVSEASERLPLALGALIMLATAFLLGRLAHSTEAGLLAAIALATLPRFVMFSRRIIIDVYIAMFMGLTLLWFALAERYPERRRLFLTLMYVSVGLGILTKGPVAAVLPAIAFTIYLALTRQLKKIGRMMLPVGLLIVAAIVLPWYVAVYFEHGFGYIKSFILQDNISRYTEPVWGPRRSYFFYIPVMLGDLFPWSFYLFFSLAVAAVLSIATFRRRVSPPAQVQAPNLRARLIDKLSAYSLNNSITLLLMIWIFTIVVFYSLSSSKEDLYISPIYTAATSLVGVVIAKFLFTEAAEQNGLRAVTLTLGLIVALVGGALIYIYSKTSPAYQLGGELAIGLVAGIGGLLVFLAAWLKKPVPAIALLASSFVILNWVFVLRTLPDFERYKPVRALCEIIRVESGPQAQAGYFRAASPSMAFYLNRQIFEFYKPEELDDYLRNNPEVYCLINKDEYEWLKPQLSVPTRTLASRPVFQVKLKTIFNERELPQIILITNKPE